MDKMTYEEIARRSELKGVFISLKEDLANYVMEIFCVQPSKLPARVLDKCQEIEDVRKMIEDIG